MTRIPFTLTKTEILIIYVHYAYATVSTHPGYPYTMPMKKFQHIRVTAFREPLRTYERDTKGIEEHPAILAMPSVAEIAE